MATVYSIQKTKWDQNVPSEKIDTTELAGRVRVAFAEYEAASLAINDVIQMFNLPNGARIVSGRLAHDALNSSTQLSVGYAAHTSSAGSTVALDADAYKAAASSAPGFIFMLSPSSFAVSSSAGTMYSKKKASRYLPPQYARQSDNR